MNSEEEPKKEELYMRSWILCWILQEIKNSVG